MGMSEFAVIIYKPNSITINVAVLFIRRGKSKTKGGSGGLNQKSFAVFEECLVRGVEESYYLAGMLQRFPLGESYCELIFKPTQNTAVEGLLSGRSWKPVIKLDLSMTLRVLFSNTKATVVKSLRRQLSSFNPP